MIYFLQPSNSCRHSARALLRHSVGNWVECANFTWNQEPFPSKLGFFSPRLAHGKCILAALMVRLALLAFDTVSTLASRSPR